MHRKLLFQISAIIIFLSAVFVVFGIYNLTTTQQLKVLNGQVQQTFGLVVGVHHIGDQVTDLALETSRLERGLITEEGLTKVIEEHRMTRDEMLGETEKAIKTLRAGLLQPEDAELLNVIELNLNKTGEIIHKLENLLLGLEQEHRRGGQTASLHIAVEDNAHDATEFVNHIFSNAHQLARNKFVVYQEAVSKAQYNSYILLILVAIFSAGMILNIMFVFVTSLRMILTGISRFKKGDFSYRVPLSSKSEFGEIANFLNQAAAYVEDRTGKLKEKIEDLERFQRATVDRELRMVELKEELENLKKKLGGKES